MKPRKAPLGDKNMIGKNTTRLRKLYNISQKELAIQMQLLGVNINKSSLSKLEGQYRAATDKEVYAIAQVFGMHTDDLFE